MDPCELDPGSPLCNTGHVVDAPEVDVLFQKLGWFILLGVLIVILLVLVFWKADRDREHGF